MSELGRAIRWGVEQRLEFIEFRIFWEDGINRSDLTEQFGISVPQASNDIRRYEECAPGNLVYDKSQKRYFASTEFSPHFLKADADQYLNRLRSVTDHLIDPVDVWFSHIPAAESMPLPHRRIDVVVLRKVLNAIRHQRSVRVLYQSMNAERPEPLWRWISPHAFANDGLRWHVRAFCHLDQRFKDFLLSRCIGADGDEAQEAPGTSDKNWHEFFNVILVPNPLLSINQQGIVAQDYCMEAGEIAISIRKSFLYYFRKRLRLDVAQALDNVRETPVIVKNQEDFEAALIEADR